ncbi:MAG TPA: hypothetical protein VK923_18375 [Euzebyales bacterium]|nr:hypothetical protein [Euzebyales bacterium]
MTDPADDDPRIDELYTLVPGEFTAARNALVKALRSEGRRELAAEVGVLRRPTAAAWAVNQAVRDHHDRYAQLLEAGDVVRVAQRRALSGVKRGGMREAARARRDLIEELAGVAVALLDAQGAAGDSHRGDIVATFDAASADAETAAVVGAGRLSQALPVSSGFGALEGLSVLAAAAPDEAVADVVEADEEVTDERPDPEEEARQQEAALARRTAIRAVEDARRQLAEAQQTAERAAAEAKRADARWTTADKAAAAAEDKARRLRGEADELAGRADRARARVADAERAAEQAADDLRDRERELQDLD